MILSRMKSPLALPIIKPHSFRTHRQEEMQKFKRSDVNRTKDLEKRNKKMQNFKLALATRTHCRPSQRRHQEKEMKRLEAVAAEMRGELIHMKRADRKQKAKLRKVQKKISKSRKANRLAAMEYARINLHIDAILHL